MTTRTTTLWRNTAGAVAICLAGAVFFAPAETHSAEIIGGFGTRSYIVELKGKDWKPSTGIAA